MTSPRFSVLEIGFCPKHGHKRGQFGFLFRQYLKLGIPTKYIRYDVLLHIQVSLPLINNTKSSLNE